MRLRSALAAVVAVSLLGAPAAALPTDNTLQSSSHYRFFKQGINRATPGAYWDPCTVIRYGIDVTYARRAGLNTSWELQRWKSVVDEYATVMGVKFRYVGEIKTRASRGKPAGGPELVITFGNDGRTGKYGYGNALRGAIAGVAGIQWSGVQGSVRDRVDRGYVVIDARDVRKVGDQRPDPRPASERPQDIVRALYMHEFGHAVGLDHVSDRSQLMYPQLVQGRPDTFGAGDRAGLRALGRQRCF